MKRYTMFLDWRSQYCENYYTIQSNLHSQCNLYKIINKIFNITEQFKEFVWNTKDPE